MTPRQVPAQTVAAPEGRLFPLLGAVLGLALLLASLWAAAAYRRALASEGNDGPREDMARDGGGAPAGIEPPGGDGGEPGAIGRGPSPSGPGQAAPEDPAPQVE